MGVPDRNDGKIAGDVGYQDADGFVYFLDRLKAASLPDLPDSPAHP